MGHDVVIDCLVQAAGARPPDYYNNVFGIVNFGLEGATARANVDRQRERGTATSTGFAMMREVQVGIVSCEPLRQPG
jgi:hypothetical protein